MNILILGCGIRNKLIQYFKTEMQDRGQILAADCSKFAPALYEADKYFIIPEITDKDYIETVLDICRNNNVKAVLSLIDPELSLLAEYRDEFLQIGTIPIIPDSDLVETCYDKYKMYKFLRKNGFHTPRSYIDKEVFLNDIKNGAAVYPVFVKPIKGSASSGIQKIDSEKEIMNIFSRHDDMMIQEYIQGEEYGVDAYIDLISKKPVAIFKKLKIKMRAGETDKAVSIIDTKLNKLVVDLIEKAGFTGVIDIDVIKAKSINYILEVNPRFGGAFPHAYECGVNIPGMIINNLMKIENEDMSFKYKEGIAMMKYSDTVIRKL